MALLVIRDVVPTFVEAREAARGLAYESIVEAVRKAETVRMGIYLGERRIGQTTTEIRPRRDGSCDIVSRTNLVLGAMGLPFDTTAQYEAHVGPDRKLVSFDAHLLSSGTQIARITGKVVGNELHLILSLGEREEARVVPVDARYLISDSLATGLRMPDLYVGRQWRVRALDIPALALGQIRLQEGTARVVRQEELLWAGEYIPCYVVELSWPNLAATAWVNEAGEVLQQKAGVMTFVREQTSENQSQAECSVGSDG